MILLRTEQEDLDAVLESKVKAEGPFEAAERSSFSMTGWPSTI